MSTILADYLGRKKLSDADFADIVGRDRTMISKIRRGVIRPTLELAAVIEAKTDGEVKMQSWVEPGGETEEAEPESEAA